MSTWLPGTSRVEPRAIVHRLLLFPATALVTIGLDGHALDVAHGTYRDSLVLLPAGSAWEVKIAALSAPVLVIDIPECLFIQGCGEPFRPARSMTDSHKPRLVDTINSLTRARASACGAERLVEMLLVRLVAASFGRFRRSADDEWLPASALIRVAGLVCEAGLPRLTLPALAAEMGLSVSAFSRGFRGAVGVTPGAYMEGLRMERAARLLRTSGLPLRTVASQIGLASAAHLSERFSKRFGLSPGRDRILRGPR